MDCNVLTGDLYLNMIRYGSANLNKNRKEVNDLNVFPIPDGDTGDNMYMTISSAVQNIQGKSEYSLSEAAKLVADGMLLGARGNSGVILSRIFSGISKGFSGSTEADVFRLNDAFRSGITESYASVATPVEGTILTVFRDAVNYASANLNNGSSIETYFRDFIKELHHSLECTPDILEVLNEYGVVDSGGAGLCYIADGMNNAFHADENASLSDSTEASSKEAVDLNKFTSDSVLSFGYCTEFLLRLQKSKTDIDSFDISELTEYLNANGESVVCFRDDTIVKVHAHTFKPGEILNYCQKYGEYLTLKIENMNLQHNSNESEVIHTKRKPRKEYAIVSVASGRGIIDTFIELGVDAVIPGGQTNNPSTEDFIKAFRKINAEKILVFPNNKNIIMTAEQAASMYTDAEVHVIKTKTIGEGYSAISMLDTENHNVEELKSELNEIIEGIVTGIVSKASKDIVLNDISIRKDDYIAYIDDTVYCDCPEADDAAMKFCSIMNTDDYAIAMVIYGNDITEKKASTLVKRLQAEYRNTEFILINGGQPIYDYILVLE